MYDDIESIDDVGESREEFLSFINQTEIKLEKLETLLRSILLKITDQKFQDIASIVATKISHKFLVEIDTTNTDMFWIDITKDIDISKRCYFFVKHRMFVDNKSFSTIKEDLLDYINNSEKIENIPEVAFSLLEGVIFNYENYELYLIKIFNSEIENKEKNFEILSEYFGIEERIVDNKIQYIISGRFEGDPDVNITPFVDFFNKEVLKMNSENTD